MGKLEKKENGGTRAAGFYVCVERSNPVIVRRISLPEDAVLRDLLALCQISLGRVVEEGKVMLGEQELIDQKMPISEAFQEEGDIRILLTGPDHRKKKGRMGLSLFLVPDEGAGAGPGRSREKEGRPSVTMHVGRNLPDGIWDIARINEIQAELKSGKAARGEEDGTFLTEKSLEYQPKKIENGIRKYFDPENASREINMKLGMPMKALLSQWKVADLKDIADANNIYVDSTMRKQGIVDSFCRSYDRSRLKEIFKDMTFSEFLAFKELVLSEKPEPAGDWEKRLNRLYYMGLLMDAGKDGARIALEVLEYYDEWYGTEEEREYLEEKLLKAAVWACSTYYGVFLWKQVEAMIGVLGEDLVSEKKKEEFFHALAEERNHLGIKRLRSRGGRISPKEKVLLYDSTRLSKGDAEKILRIRPDEPERFFLPAKEDIHAATYQRFGLTEKAWRDMEVLFEQYGSYTWYGSRADQIKGRVDSVASALAQKGDAVEAAGKAVSQMPRLDWAGDGRKELVLKQLLDILGKEAERVPVMALWGYSKADCPKDILRHMEEEREKLRKEEEAKRSEAETMKAKSGRRKKAVAVRKVTGGRRK